MKILVAEDDPVARLDLVDALTDWGYEVTTAADGGMAWEVLSRDDAPALAILDWQMPVVDGLEVCRRLRALERTPYVYLIVLTASSRAEDVVAALDAGADDFVQKPCEPRELEVRLRAGRRIVELQERLHYQASHDALTGVWNRGVIEELLRRELSRSAREGSPVAVLMVDLDHFKHVNDEHGHAAGDAVLREASRRMEASMRRHDSLGRYGGEEFLVLLPGTESCGVMEVGERVRACVADGPMRGGREPLYVTASVGAAATVRPHRVTPEALVRAADEALYRAKANGRNQLVLGEVEEEAPSWSR